MVEIASVPGLAGCWDVWRGIFFVRLPPTTLGRICFGIERIHIVNSEVETPERDGVVGSTIVEPEVSCSRGLGRIHYAYFIAGECDKSPIQTVYCIVSGTIIYILRNAFQ